MNCLTSPTLFNMTPVCFACEDLGFIPGKIDAITGCWRNEAGAEHNAANAAARMIGRAVQMMPPGKIPVNAHTFSVAKALSRATSERPCNREEILKKYFGYTNNPLRKFHYVIEELRKEWLLPVGSRKEAPSGYWIITSEADFKKWFERSNSAPITQLTTNYKVAKRNFPIFAEQMELEFFNDIQRPLDAAA